MANTLYATPAEVRQQIQSDDTGLDAALQIILNGVAALIDRMGLRDHKLDGYIADSVASARTFPGNGQAVMSIDECIEITLIEVKASLTDSTYVSWAATDWLAATGDYEKPDFTRLPKTFIMVDPSGEKSIFTNSRLNRRSWWSDYDDPEPNYAVPTVRVTAKWGYAAVVPPAIKQAAIIQAGRVMKRAQSAYGDTLASVELGQLLYIKTLDPDVTALLQHGRYIEIAV